MIKPVPALARMEAYAMASLTVPEGKDVISLSQNESLRGPSPKVDEAVARAMRDAALYPDPDWTGLREGLAKQYAIAAEQILCGAGSLDLIGCLMRAYAGPGRAVLAPAHSYPFFRTAALSVGARFDQAPAAAGHADVDAMLAALRPDTAVVCLANPGNPTGTRLPNADLARLRAQMPRDALLILDEAYGEFADGLEAPLFPMVARGNTVVLRTFSKAYGLAGMRIGWGLFPPEIAAEVRKVMNPNNLAAVSQAAALAALDDQAYMRETCALTADLRVRAAARLAEAGLTTWPSHTNFLSILMPSAAAAAACDTALRAEGIILRRQAGAGLPHVLRLTLGAAPAVAAALAYLSDWTTEHLT